MSKKYNLFAVYYSAVEKLNSNTPVQNLKTSELKNTLVHKNYQKGDISKETETNFNLLKGKFMFSWYILFTGRLNQKHIFLIVIFTFYILQTNLRVKKKTWIFQGTKDPYIIPITLHVKVKILYFNLCPFDLVGFRIWNIKGLRHQVAKIRGLENQRLKLR